VVDPEKLFELAKLFDNKETKVLGTLPRNIKLEEVVGITEQADETTKVAIRRGNMLYLCWAETSEIIEDKLRLKEEIKERADWEERYEAWELYGVTRPLTRMQTLIVSRFRNEEEKEDCRKRYGWEC